MGREWPRADLERDEETIVLKFFARRLAGRAVRGQPVLENK